MQLTGLCNDLNLVTARTNTITRLLRRKDISILIDLIEAPVFARCAPSLLRGAVSDAGKLAPPASDFFLPA